MDLPRFSQLPLVDGFPSARGLFGADDSLGTMNLITNAVSRQAAKLVRTGEVVPLSADLEALSPPLFGRSPIRHEVSRLRGGEVLDDQYSHFNPQSGSHWDALAHRAFQPGKFYNGATLADVLSGERNTIAAVAHKGIVTRGVLLDLESVARDRYSDFSPGSPHAFDVHDLEEARRRAGVEFKRGDILVIHTGFLRWYMGLPLSERVRVSHPDRMQASGLAHTREMSEYLWDSQIAGVSSDGPSLEVWPTDPSREAFPYGVLHRVLLARLGMMIGELWDLRRLIDACRPREDAAFLLTSAPVRATRGVASPANALAVL